MSRTAGVGRMVQLRPRTKGYGGCALEVSEGDWLRVEPFIGAVFSEMRTDGD